MPFVWLEAGTREARTELESGAIALLGNFGREPLDAQSREWLGGHSKSIKVRQSGLWNREYVDLPRDSRIVSS